MYNYLAYNRLKAQVTNIFWCVMEIWGVILKNSNNDIRIHIKINIYLFIIYLFYFIFHFLRMLSRQNFTFSCHLYICYLHKLPHFFPRNSISDQKLFEEL